MGLIPQHSIDAVINANDIVDVVSHYVRLEKKSSLNLFGLCPFHEEKTPSFSVSPGKQIFYCFGCHKGGNVIKFIQEIEHLSFPEAVRFLADRAGIAIEETEEDSQWREKADRQRAAAEALLEAARFYYTKLESPDGQEARQYLDRRGVDRTLRRRYGLGYAPAYGETLYEGLRKRGIPDSAMLDAGLIAKSSRQEGYYDFFRHRVMFPIIDGRGKVLAFGGRAISDRGPKYINSPDTVVYRKGKHLFGLPQAINANVREWFIVEGYMDVIALAKVGIYHAVAPLGTALTDYQARTVGRHVDNVLLLMDSDRAGREAALKAHEIFGAVEVPAKFILLKEAKDPDDYLNKFGIQRLTASLRATLDKTEYLLELLKADVNTEIGVPQADYRNRAIDVLALEKDGIKREIYAGRLAKELQLNPASLVSEIDRRRSLLIEGEGSSVSSTSPSKATQRKRPRILKRPAGRELFLLTLLTLDRSLAQLRLDLPESNLRGFAVTGDVKDLLLSDEAGRPISSDDFDSVFMRNLAQSAIEEAKTSELTLAGLDAAISNTLARLTESLPEEEDRERLTKSADALHTLLIRQHREITDAKMTKDELRDIFLDRLAYIRMSGWTSNAERWNSEARELELSGSGKEAERLYAKAAKYTMAAETYRMLIQGD